MLGDDLCLGLLGCNLRIFASSSFARTLGSIFRLLSLLFLFIVLGFLQADEVLTINLVELLLDIVNDVVDFRNQYEL